MKCLIMLQVLGWTVLLLLGVLFLMKGANFLVEGGSVIASYLGVPALIIGLTLVSFGTSLPELGASLNAVLKGRSGIAVGNVIGSNIANILLVLGVSSIIRPISIDLDVIKKEIPIMLSVMALFLVLALPLFSVENSIERWQGFVLLIALLAYLLFFGKKVLNRGEDIDDKKVAKVERRESFDWLMNILKVIVGVSAVVIGSELVIRSAVFYINRFALIEGVVGLTIIAFATSLPELSTTSVAALREESDIALGNVIGSNTFNILMVIGISAVILPLTFSGEIYSSFIVMIAASVFLTTSMYTGEKLSRIEGIVMVIAYFAYILYLY